MANTPFEAVPLGNVAGTQVTTAASAAATAIPNNNAGERPRHIRLSIAAATGFCYFRLTGSSAACTVNDAVLEAGAPVIVPVRGNSHVSTLEGTAAIKMNITPVED